MCCTSTILSTKSSLSRPFLSCQFIKSECQLWNHSRIHINPSLVSPRDIIGAKTSFQLGYERHLCGIKRIDAEKCEMSAHNTLFIPFALRKSPLRYFTHVYEDWATLIAPEKAIIIPVVLGCKANTSFNGDIFISSAPLINSVFAIHAFLCLLDKLQRRPNIGNPAPSFWKPLSP